MFDSDFSMSGCFDKNFKIHIMVCRGFNLNLKMMSLMLMFESGLGPARCGRSGSLNKIVIKFILSLSIF